MGAIETLTKLINLKSAYERGSETSAPEKPGNLITSDMKYIAAQKKAQEKQQLENLKYITGRYTDLYFKANNNRALQNNVLQTMKDLKDNLPPVFKQQFDLFTSAGPFSETAEKKRKWVELRGERPKDVRSADSDDLLLTAQTKFAQQDYDMEQQHFLTGQLPVAPKRRTIGLDDKTVGIRGEDGMVSLVSGEAYMQQEGVKQLGKNLGTLIANDFKEKTKSWNYVSGGQEYTTTESHDFLTGKKVRDTVAGKKLNERAHWESKFLTEVLAFASTGVDDKNTASGRIAKRIIDFTAKAKTLEEIEDLANQAIVGVPEFNNIYLSVTDEDFDVGSMFEWSYGLSKTATMIPIYGEMSEFKTRDGAGVIGFWDRQMDIVTSADGQRIGSYDQATSYFLERSSSEFFGEGR